MRRWFVATALISIALSAGYVGYRSNEPVWLATTGTAIVGLIGMWFCIRWHRYAALNSAISLIALTALGSGLHLFSAEIQSEPQEH